jgi:restriction system protein
MEYPEYAAYNTGRNKKKDCKTSPIAVSDLTPTEQLEQAFDSIESDLAADLLAKVMDQSPAFFEQLVVDLLVKMGYGGSFADSAKVTQLSNDEGIDGIIYEDKLGLDKIYIQAKRWSNQVGRPVIQQFAGALVGQNATKGVFITTSSFSDEAKKYAEQQQQKSLKLIDGKMLTALMIKYEVGIFAEDIIKIYRLDTAYFE